MVSRDLTFFQSTIDKDLLEMHSLMAKGDFDQAMQVFKRGANADPYAKLHLEAPLLQDMSPTSSTRPLIALGMNDQQEPVMLHLRATTTKGASTLFVMYNETTSNCRVGARMNPTMEACLASTGGIVIENYGAFNYYYDKMQDNMFWSSLYGFSEHQAEQMFQCRDKCPYPEYEKFYKYYGQLDYGALWMTAALKGESTANGPLTFEHGQEDFSKLSASGRMAAVETAAVTMNIRTHVNRIMTEWAIEACRHCDEDQCSHVEIAWDQAVAHFVGSLVQPNEEHPGGFESGNLFYGLADELCQDFATCGMNGVDLEGTAAVNHEILQQFQAGRVLLEKKSCAMADLMYGQIVHLMTVPLIQGTLRSAYRLANTHKGDSEEQGRGVAFMASILPDLYSCNKQDADVIYNELNLSGGKIPDFGTVKEAFERNYQCLSISCEDVGGLYDAKNARYVDSGSPCGKRRARQHERPRNEGSGQSKLLAQVILVGSVAMVVILLTLNRARWVPVVSSRADLFLSRFGTRYQHVSLQSLQNSNSLHMTPLYALETDVDPCYEMTGDHSESSSDYHDMEMSERSDYHDIDGSDRSYNP